MLKTNLARIGGYFDIVTPSDEGMAYYVLKLYIEKEQKKVHEELKDHTMTARLEGARKEGDKGSGGHDDTPTDDSHVDELSKTKKRKIDRKGKIRPVIEKSVDELKTYKVNACNEYKRTNLLLYTLMCNQFKLARERMPKETKGKLNRLVKLALLQKFDTKKTFTAEMRQMQKKRSEATSDSRLSHMACVDNPHLFA